ncbi:adenylyltransferase/cytidyltransferase family protein [Patescibacteria group bacterium]|nr:adenylyltransferase/cytidyltransferase family protein [Patescibacteria group bacterium]MBU1895352.1 adenylyltransferase/cytidyltransferase family protein [Patescibacteria group bacterium]
MKKVMVFGTFDIVHCGHLHMFEEAKEYGDELVVVVARDVNVERIKETGAMHTEEERYYFLDRIKTIDRVILGERQDVYKVIREERPDVIALGYDQKIYVDLLADKISEFGLNSQIVRLVPYEPNKFKSSKIKKYIERVV